MARKKQMLTFVLMLSFLLSTCATKNIGVGSPLDWSSEKLHDVEYTDNVFGKHPFEDEGAVLTPNERQLFAYSLNKVGGPQCREDLNTTLWGILRGQQWAIALKSIGDAAVVVVSHWGACVPASCEPTDVALFLQNYLQRPVLSVNETACQLSNVGSGRALHVDGGMFAYAVVLFLFILLATLSTAYHCYLIYASRSADDVSKRALQQETLTIALLSFSVIENTKKLFQASKDQMGLNSINGIKAMAMLLILAGHALSFIYGSPTYNVAFVAEQTKFPTFAFLYNSLLFVDTFLLLSGFLFCRIMLVELHRRRGQINPLILYIGRYIRLTPAYMAIIGFYMTWFPSIGSGPLWPERIRREQERCQASWWLNILYVNNYFNTDKFVSTYFYYAHTLVLI
ncbi:PREDICTED: nose resistant to fluoxetine protein 6-like [Rhagoletis zephyria]|uniref:nose resistant to fluoxetine protein 6-like n=1 Tax=Rhagoletis zephyria TaxID=28612 RepID=UPI0008118471|nr:PREDICTED: nose resistant to fluoxetine protein 6-like [Rhagoletis zephyria]